MAWLVLIITLDLETNFLKLMLNVQTEPQVTLQGLLSSIDQIYQQKFIYRKRKTLLFLLIVNKIWTINRVVLKQNMSRNLLYHEIIESWPQQMKFELQKYVLATDIMDITKDILENAITWPHLIQKTPMWQLILIVLKQICC